MNLSKRNFSVIAVLLLVTYFLTPLYSSAEEENQSELLEAVVEESTENTVEDIEIQDSTMINKTGWNREESGWYYYSEESEMQTGWIEVGTRKYYMDEKGLMQTGWLKQDGIWYYLGDSGAMRTAWTKVRNTWYYMNEAGEMQTGWITVGDTDYYLNDGGSMRIGWYQDNGIWYYFSGSGAKQSGWTKVRNTWYYMNEAGAMQTGWQKVGTNWYYLRDSGAMRIGWQKLGNTWYYMSGSGAMQTGWTKVGTTWYYMRNSGAMRTGWQKVGATWYYLTDSGAMRTGWQRLGNTWYYMNSSGAMQTGWMNIGNKWYYLNDNGAMHTGWVQDGGYWYYMDYTGAMHTKSEEKKRVVYIDPGHGGSDSGAARGGATEKQLNLQVSNYLIPELESMGYLVLTSRDVDKWITLDHRANEANGGEADIFISVHHNAGGGSSARGIETFIHHRVASGFGQETNRNNFGVNDPRISDSLRLADAVQGNLIRDTGLSNRGVKGNNFSVLRRTTMPAILVELGFMDNATELSIIRSSAYQQKAAKAIATGVERYFEGS